MALASAHPALVHSWIPSTCNFRKLQHPLSSLPRPFHVARAGRRHLSVVCSAGSDSAGPIFGKRGSAVVAGSLAAILLLAPVDPAQAGYGYGVTHQHFQEVALLTSENQRPSLGDSFLNFRDALVERQRTEDSKAAGGVLSDAATRALKGLATAPAGGEVEVAGPKAGVLELEGQDIAQPPPAPQLSSTPLQGLGQKLKNFTKDLPQVLEKRTQQAKGVLGAAREQAGALGGAVKGAISRIRNANPATPATSAITPTPPDNGPLGLGGVLSKLKPNNVSKEEKIVIVSPPVEDTGPLGGLKKAWASFTEAGVARDVKGTATTVKEGAITVKKVLASLLQVLSFMFWLLSQALGITSSLVQVIAKGLQ